MNGSLCLKYSLLLLFEEGKEKDADGKKMMEMELSDNIGNNGI